MLAIGIRQHRLRRISCGSCQTFSETELEDEGDYAERERERVHNTKDSCSFSIIVASTLEDLVNNLTQFFKEEMAPQLFPDLLTILEEFSSRLKMFRSSRHQD